jgi:leucyl-tRNA synthetase
MTLYNEIGAAEPLEQGIRPEVCKEVLELLTLMLAPMTPHLSEELWEMLGHQEGLSQEAWPAFNPDLARDEEIEFVVQINGRVRGRIKAPAGLPEDEMVNRALAEQFVTQQINGKRIVKRIVVPDKLVNLVIQ